jgi:subtilisin family serine protease
LSVALFLLLGTLGFATPRANAQWIVIELHPADATESYAWGGDGVQQAGYVIKGGAERASLWMGTAASWQDLSPPGATQSFINGASGGQQAGYAFVGGSFAHASLWTGTAASRVDLHPAGEHTVLISLRP